MQQVAHEITIARLGVIKKQIHTKIFEFTQAFFDKTPKAKFQGKKMIHKRLGWITRIIIGLIAFCVTSSAFGSLPENGKNKVAYYVFDCTPIDQDKLRITEFTDEANIVVVFEGTLWELADSTHYGSSSSYILSINGGPYAYYKQILDDIQTLRGRGVNVIMNLDDRSSWSTDTPFTAWDGTAYDYKQFAQFVYDCVTEVGFDGISLDVEHGATDNEHYRNLITELGTYFGPLSSNPNTMIYTGAFYSGGAPGPIFRENSLGQYLNFVMDMAYWADDFSRFNYWAATLGNAKVMLGMVYDYNSESSAIAHAVWHPTPDKAGVMVFAGNKVKSYTDNILAALDSSNMAQNSVVTLYQDCDYGGWAAGFPVGSFNTDSLLAAGGLDDDVSSIRILDGYSITLYPDDNYGGFPITITKDDRCLDDNYFNDRISSFVIEALNTNVASTETTQATESIDGFQLSQNYPNPFNPETVISYQLAMNSKVQLVIYDVLGRQVKTLVNQTQNAGQYAVRFDGSDFNSGIYYYKLQAGDFQQVNKMLLIK